MTYTIAPACKALLIQATSRYPNRDRSGDGTIGDTAHAASRSWHNPSREDGSRDPNGVVLAVDLTHDPANGCDAHALARALVASRDPRVSEAISNGQIWTTARASEGWRRYSGSNPHEHHCHITVAWRYQMSTAAWWTTAPSPTVQEDVMSPAQEAKLDKVLAMLAALIAPRLPDKSDANPNQLSLADLYTQDEKHDQ